MPKGIPKSGINRGWFKKGQVSLNGMLGKKHSKEWVENTKKRMIGNKYGKALKGFKHTEKMKEKMRSLRLLHPIIMRGESSPTKRLEVRRKISEAQKGSKNHNWKITNEIYNKKLKEYQEKLADLEIRMGQHTQADESFYMNAKTLLFILKKSCDVFKGSEPATKRQILNFLLQNIVLDGKKLSFTLKTPFNRVLEATTSDTKLPLLDAFRTLDWELMGIEMNSLNFVA